MWKLGKKDYTYGYKVHQLCYGRWVTKKGMYGTKISVGPNGLPWVINKKGRVHSLNSKDQWVMTYTRRKAVEIAVGPTNEVWILSGAITNKKGKTDYKIYKVANGRMQQVVGKALKIAVGRDGEPWILMSNNKIYRR